jgi:hypothetical protein
LKRKAFQKYVNGKMETHGVFAIAVVVELRRIAMGGAVARSHLLAAAVDLPVRDHCNWEDVDRQPADAAAGIWRRKENSPPASGDSTKQPPADAK